MATPNGSLQKYDPKTGKVTIISKDLPSDPKDVDRLNKISPEEPKAPAKTAPAKSAPAKDKKVTPVQKKKEESA